MKRLSQFLGVVQQGVKKTILKAVAIGSDAHFGLSAVAVQSLFRSIGKQLDRLAVGIGVQ